MSGGRKYDAHGGRGATRVPLSEVERTLTALWEEVTAVQGDVGVLRVRELNLVALCLAGTSTDGIVSTLQQVSRRHPARMVLVVETPENGQDPAAVDAADEEGERLTAEVSSECIWASGDKARVCVEMVRVDASREDLEQLGALLAPVLLPDLPTVAWVPRSLEGGSSFLAEVWDVADRILVDSAGFGDPVAALRFLQALAARLPKQAELVDLSWTRLTPWRGMIAELFEPRERRPMLGHIKGVSVTYGSESAAPGADLDWRPAAARTLLLLAWLGTRLGWQPRTPGWTTEGDALVAEFDRFGGGHESAQIKAALQPHRCKPGTFGGIESVELEIAPAGSEDKGAVFTLSRSPESGMCATRLRRGARDTQVRVLEVPLPSEADLLSEELAHHGKDEVFNEALAFAARLADMPGSEGLGE